MNSINIIVNYLKYLNGIGISGRENTNAPQQPSGTDLINIAKTGLFTNKQYIKALGAMLSIDRPSIDNAVNSIPTSTENNKEEPNNNET